MIIRKHPSGFVEMWCRTVWAYSDFNHVIPPIRYPFKLVDIPIHQSMQGYCIPPGSSDSAYLFDVIPDLGVRNSYYGDNYTYAYYFNSPMNWPAGDFQLSYYVIGRWK